MATTFQEKDALYDFFKELGTFPIEVCPDCRKEYYACKTCGRCVWTAEQANQPHGYNCTGKLEYKVSLICHQRDYHHVGDCCTHCGNDERKL